MKHVWIYCQEPAQLLDGRVRPEWRAVADGYLVQLNSPDLWPQPDFEAEWWPWVGAECHRVRDGANGLPWRIVTQAANRARPGRKKILLPWDDDEGWMRYCARVDWLAQQAKSRGAVGLVHDLEDYSHRFPPPDQPQPDWGWQGGPPKLARARAQQWRAAVGDRLPVSVLDHCSSSMVWPAWRAWARALTTAPRAQPALVWEEETFFFPIPAQLAGIRIALRVMVGTDRIGVGLQGDPVRMSNHPLAALAEKRGLPVWVYPW